MGSANFGDSFRHQLKRIYFFAWTVYINKHFVKPNKWRELCSKDSVMFVVFQYGFSIDFTTMAMKLFFGPGMI